MEQMFDIFASNDAFLMRAPLATIRAVWVLHNDAVKRIEHETGEPGGVCRLHANGKLRLGGEFVVIQKAVGALEERRAKPGQPREFWPTDLECRVDGKTHTRKPAGCSYPECRC